MVFKFIPWFLALLSNYLEKKRRKNHTQTHKKEQKNAPNRIRTGDLSITSPASYHWTVAQVIKSLLKEE